MTTDAPAVKYRRRHRLPILIVVVVLLIGAGIVWYQALKPAAAAATGCNTPGPAPTSASATSRTSAGPTGTEPAGATPPATDATATDAATTDAATTDAASTPIVTSLGTFVATNTLSAVRPADPANIRLSVVNASNTSGLAGTVTADLLAAGFQVISPAAGDPLYPAADLVCPAEVRFGPAGQAQARTVLIVAPCAQLVMDDRIDQSVDLALGSLYEYVQSTDDMKAQLKALTDAAAPPAVIEGQTQAPRPQASIPPLPKADCSANATTKK